MILGAESSDPRVRQMVQIKRMQESARARYPEPTMPQPSQEEISAWCNADPQAAKATDGCDVDLNAVCSHGYPSWLIMYGLVPDPNE